MFWTWSVRVCVQNFAIVRHDGVSEEIGPRQNKQTLNYLIDDDDQGITQWTSRRLPGLHRSVTSERAASAAAAGQQDAAHHHRYTTQQCAGSYSAATPPGPARLGPLANISLYVRRRHDVTYSILVNLQSATNPRSVALLSHGTWSAAYTRHGRQTDGPNQPV